MADTPEEKVQLTREELVELLSKPLDPNLDYFDATPAIQAIAEAVRNQHRLIEFLFHTLGIQGKTLIDVREMQGAQAGAIEFLAGLTGAEPDEGPLVGIKPPAIVMPGKPN
jgi:hypothetical protein